MLPHTTSPPPLARLPQQAVLQRLAREIEQLEHLPRAAAAEPPPSGTGCAGLDALLPAGGYAAGSIVEYLRATAACGASTLAWQAAAAALRASEGFLVMVDIQHTLYPPALASQGIDLQKVIFVRPASQADALWAVDQALRTPGVAAVVAELERIDERSARRLQLAAECGAGLGLLIRGAAARQQPSWAEVQWLVRTAPSPRPAGPLATAHPTAAVRRWQVQLARVRGGRAGQTAWVELDPLTGRLQLVPPSDVSLRNRRHGQPAASSHAPSQSALHLAAQLAHPAAGTPAAARLPAHTAAGEPARAGHAGRAAS